MFSRLTGARQQTANYPAVTVGVPEELFCQPASDQNLIDRVKYDRKSREGTTFLEDLNSMDEYILFLRVLHHPFDDGAGAKEMMRLNS